MICEKCSRDLPLVRFTPNEYLSGGRLPWCEACTATVSTSPELYASYRRAYMRLYMLRYNRMHPKSSVALRWSIHGIGELTILVRMAKASLRPYGDVQRAIRWLRRTAKVDGIISPDGKLRFEAPVGLVEVLEKLAGKGKARVKKWRIR